jgi:hypothetical protein
MLVVLDARRVLSSNAASGLAARFSSERDGDAPRRMHAHQPIRLAGRHGRQRLVERHDDVFTRRLISLRHDLVLHSWSVRRIERHTDLHV